MLEALSLVPASLTLHELGFPLASQDVKPGSVNVGDSTAKT